MSDARVNFFIVSTRSVSFTNAILFVECQSMDADRDRRTAATNRECQMPMCSMFDVSHATHLLNVFKMVFRFRSAFATVYYIRTTDSTQRILFYDYVFHARVPLTCLHCHRKKHSNIFAIRLTVERLLHQFIHRQCDCIRNHSKSLYRLSYARRQSHKKGNPNYWLTHISPSTVMLVCAIISISIERRVNFIRNRTNERDARVRVFFHSLSLRHFRYSLQLLRRLRLVNGASEW